MTNEQDCLFQKDVTIDVWKNVTETANNAKLPSDEFFHNFMLDISQGIHDLGSIRWELALCLLLAWTIVYCALWKGIKSFGKVVYFTALFPYCILVILLVRAATLPGYMDGITFYLTPKWEKLLEINVWADACIQIFFSLGVTWGGMITLASYNQFNNNVFRDALLVGMGNCITSFFAGFIIFGIIGYMAHELGVPVEEVAAQGAGLAFIAYPEAVSRMPISPLWSILFFLMLLSLGFGTQFSTTETVVTVLQDQFPVLRGKNRKWLTLCVCSFMYLCGLSMITEGGMYVLQLVDNHSATYSALILGCLEVSVMAWVYGVDRFLDDLHLMLGFYPYPRILWKAAWMFISPMIVVLILIFSWINYEGSTYDGYIFPAWANVLGWCITFSSVVCVPIVAIWKICHEEGTLVARVQKLMQPSEEWGPASSQHRLPECNGGEDGLFNPGMKVGCGAQGSSVTLLTNASNSNILREYKELATTELETLNENEEEDDDDGLNMRAIRMAASAKK
jgi:solute carrier family 6 amino acid transporter-like protein 5/7/9/14